MRNPVFLWAHQSDELPIGKVVDIEVNGGMLNGTVEYADADLNPFGDMVYRLVKAEYLNAVSVSWNPLDWRMSTDKNRPRGIDFKMVDLLEVSQVPVPALATALATARAAGIDTAPLYQWAERLLDGGGMVVIPRTELEMLRREAKMPAAPKTKIVPEAAPSEPIAQAPSAQPVGKRGLYAIACLAETLSSLGFLAMDAQWEADMEGDGSTVPSQILAVAKAAGQVLVNMTVEEVGEFIAMVSGDDSEDLVAVDAVDDVSRGAKTLIALARIRVASKETVAVAPVPAGEVPPDLSRAGKVLSGANKKTLRDAHGMIGDGLAMVGTILDAADQNDDPPAGDDDGDESARDATAALNRRKRKAAAIKRKTALAA
jgi:HK97 family phage prohead protease